MADRICALPGCDVVVTGRRMTCSAAHRQAWNRLKKRVEAQRDNIGDSKPADAAQLVEGADPVGLALEVMKEELRPHVRDALDEDVLKAIRGLVVLTPQLIESLGKDLLSGDPIARGRAQTLVSKYTLGAFSADKEASTRPINLNFGSMPVPGEPLPDTTPAGDTVQQCERCGEPKTLDHFEPGAGRCNECQAEIRADIEGQYLT